MSIDTVAEDEGEVNPEYDDWTKAKVYRVRELAEAEDYTSIESKLSGEFKASYFVDRKHEEARYLSIRQLPDYISATITGNKKNCGAKEVGMQPYTLAGIRGGLGIVCKRPEYKRRVALMLEFYSVKHPTSAPEYIDLVKSFDCAPHVEDGTQLKTAMTIPALPDTWNWFTGVRTNLGLPVNAMATICLQAQFSQDTGCDPGTREIAGNDLNRWLRALDWRSDGIEGQVRKLNEIDCPGRYPEKERDMAVLLDYMRGYFDGYDVGSLELPIDWILEGGARPWARDTLSPEEEKGLNTVLLDRFTELSLKAENGLRA